MQNQIQTQTTINNAAAPVVLNDTIPTIAVGKNDTVSVAPASAIAIYKRIEQLVTEREVWEQGALRTSNEQLYTLLAKCYTLHGEMCGGSSAAKAMREELKGYINAKSYRFLDSTHAITKIVKCVFGVVDRRRISTYSLVLREALTQEIKADAVAAFISSKGGVEEIRRSKSATAKTPKQRAELGKQVVSGNQLAVVSSEKIAEKLNPDNAGDDLIAIVTQQADGSLIVRKLINSQSVLNAALACAYSANKVEVKQATDNKSAANDDKAVDVLIQQAANS